jgi:[ribosomal protein S5]-alanine N-acetyltransferase
LNTDTWLRFIGDRNIHSIDDAINYINTGPRKSYKEHGFGLYLIELKNGSSSIGLCGLLQRDYLDNPDIGFALLPDYERKGYAFEAASATLLYSKNELLKHTISAITNISNEKSMKLLEKIGMSFENELKLESGEIVNLFNIKFRR